MNTNIELDDELLQEAFRLTNLKTEQELIDFALQELIRIRKKRNLLDLSGQILFAPDYDHKASREDRHVSD
ncbi:MAG: type II toxin-antitoxin system VapB family antitoxin [Nostocaceae cyanobacterium]|nr:type II toxin-antitoxin system VapB family antitoxin [Nostocaceae cyanobacterium]